MAVAGIKYTKDALGRNRYVRIDLEKYGDIIEDFLDGLEDLERKGEPTDPFDEALRKEFRRIRLENHCIASK